MKRKWLVTDVTAVRAPERAERTILGGDFGLALFWPIQAVFVVEEPLRDAGTPS